jgi:hypothetical protein
MGAISCLAFLFTSLSSSKRIKNDPKKLPQMGRIGRIEIGQQLSTISQQLFLVPKDPK